MKIIYSIVLMLCLVTTSYAEDFHRCESPIVKMVFQESSGSVKISLKNNTKKDFMFFDSIRSEGFGTPFFFGIMIRDQSSNVITQYSQYDDGFISSSISKSSLVRTPLTMATLRPSEKISRWVKISDLIAGTQPFWKVSPEKLKSVSIRFRIQIFLDPYMKESMRCVSDWYEVKDIATVHL